jgi:hypothetical protein
MLRRVALVRTDVSEELPASIIRVTRIGELVTLAVTSNGRTLRQDGTNQRARNNVTSRSLILFTLMMETILSFES